MNKATQFAKPWREATVDEFLTMQDAVESLWFLSRRDKVISVEGKRVELSEVAAQVVGAINAPPAVDERTHLSEQERKSLKDGNWRAWVTRVESWVIMLDGGNPGAVHRWLFRPLREAFDRYHAERLKVVQDLDRRVKKLDLGDGEEIRSHELNFTFRNRAALIGALKHSGNISNLRKFLLGERLVEEQVEGSEIAFDTRVWWSFIDRMIEEGELTRQHFEYVQHVWDAYDKLLPRLQATHFEAFGYRFEEIQAEPIEVTFKGEASSTIFRGGYVPATTDTMRREVEVDPTRMDDPLADQARHMREQLQPKRGFTFSRVEYNRPLVLSVTLDAHHLDEHLRFIHMQVPSKDILRIIRDRDVADSIKAIDPHAVKDMFLPWMNATVNNSVLKRGQLATKWENALVHLRKATGAGIMFGKLTTGLQQLTGLGQSLIHVELPFLRSAAVAFMSGGQGQRAAEKSTFMRLRLDNQIGQIRDDIDILTKPGWMTNITQWTDRNAFFMQRFFQNPVDVITWNGRYEQGIAQGLSEEDAVAAADSAVRLSQGSGTAADISNIERAGAMTRLVLQFSNFWFTTFNSILTRQGPERVKALAVTAVFAGLVAGTIVRVLNGGWEDDEDDGALWDDVLMWAFRDTLSGVTAAAVPVIGPAFQAVILDEFGGRIGLGGAGIGTLERGLHGVATVATMPFDIISGEFDLTGSDIKDITSLFTLITGLPFVTPGRSVAYGVDVLRGDEELNPIFGLPREFDFIRGLITGRASER